MFTGIVTDIGTVTSAVAQGDLRVSIQTRFDTGTIDLGASIACSGACMTVVATGGLGVLFMQVTDAIDFHEPDLTLDGLVLLYEGKRA